MRQYKNEKNVPSKTDRLDILMCNKYICTE